MYAIDHCEMSRDIFDSGLDSDDVRELVIERSGEIIENMLKDGKKGDPHEFPGIELMAMSIASHVIDEGAIKVAKDFHIREEEMEKLKSHAASRHISTC